MAICIKTPIIYFLSIKDSEGFEPLYGHKLEESLKPYNAVRSQHFCKWHDGVLMVNSAGWFLSRQTPIPYSRFRYLSPGRADEVPLLNFAHLVTEAASQEYDWLHDRLSMNVQPEMLAIFKFIDTNPHCLTTQGAKVRADWRSYLKLSKVVGDFDLQGRSDAQIRLINK